MWDRAEGRAIRRAELSPELAVRVMARLEDFPGTLDCYMEDNCGWMEARYYAALDDWILDPVSRRIIREMRRPMEDLRGYVGRRGRPVQKIQSYFLDEATQRAVLAALAEEFPELSVACSLPGNVELTHRDATKGAAMTALCAHLGIPLERAAAFGDERNDCSMLAAAGLGVAMGNAAPEAKAAARLVTGTNQEDGVAPDAAPAAGGGGMTEAYYFRQLDKAGQAAYHAMKTGLAALRPAFPVPGWRGGSWGTCWPACGWTARSCSTSPASPTGCTRPPPRWSCCPSTASTRGRSRPTRKRWPPGWTACAARPWG